jgi:hypothetical protein
MFSLALHVFGLECDSDQYLEAISNEVGFASTKTLHPVQTIASALLLPPPPPGPVCLGTVSRGTSVQCRRPYYMENHFDTTPFSPA